MRNGGPALEAVTAAVGALEEEPLFNAGRGAVVTDDGKQEMDAAIMEDTTRRAGTVAGIFGPRNRAQDYPRRRMVGAILALPGTLRIRPGWSARGLRLAFVVFLLIISARMFLDLAASLTT
ncbi:isoaspartyl peptidase/L-asparaginase [Marivita sp.]|uniref:isoaspartyl peptidase/L-asparaginase n=1 Tax=Marivita sp. TaxID=2003365 RepID=UPI0025C5A5A5|nr:isoaspartyl peptidase/L-asparaginase [Marivita sp.]